MTEELSENIFVSIMKWCKMHIIYITVVAIFAGFYIYSYFTQSNHNNNDIYRDNQNNNNKKKKHVRFSDTNEYKYI
jgi:hypothetical protein